MVKRRKMLIGMGALSAGAAGVLGTGATNNFNVYDRGMSVNVVADGNSGVIGLLDTSPGDIVNTAGDDKLEIDFAEYSASDGVPLDSWIELGNTNDFDNEATPSNSYGGGGLAENSVFAVANYAAGQDIELEYEFTAGSGFNVNEQGSRMHIGYRYDNSFKGNTSVADNSPAGWSSAPYDKNASDGDTLISETVNDPGGTSAVLSPGEAAHFGVIVNTGGKTGDEPGFYDGSGVSTDENLSGELSFSATQV